jgi:hypothetical protein
VLFAAEVLVIFGFSQPSSLARSLARRPALGLGTVFLPAANSRVTAKQLLATQASTSSGFDHRARLLLDRIMPRSAPSPDTARVYAVIPIAVFMIIDAGTASCSSFHRTPKNVHDHPGIVFTSRWNPRSPCAGNREHDRPEYAQKNSHCIWVHWNMRDINYGFQAIEHRHRVLGGSPTERLPEERKFDLARALVSIYGVGYASHPRLQNIVKLNKITD